MYKQMITAIAPTEATSNPTTPSPTYTSSDTDFSITVSVSTGVINETFIKGVVNTQLQVSLSRDDYELQTTVVSNGTIVVDVIVFDNSDIDGLDKETIEEGIIDELDPDGENIYSVNASLDEQQAETEDHNSELILAIIAIILGIIIIFENTLTMESQI